MLAVSYLKEMLKLVLGDTDDINNENQLEKKEPITARAGNTTNPCQCEPEMDRDRLEGFQYM